jgi:hypothetical protein
MALQLPSTQTGVPRDDASNVVDAMLLDDRVKWISIVFEKTDGGVDHFTVTPFTEHPARGDKS